MRRQGHWPAAVIWILLLGGLALLVVDPRLLAPPTTRLLERLLLPRSTADLHVREYHLRPFRGVDIHDVSLTLPGGGGALTLIAADTLQLDFALGDVLGRSTHLQRAEVRGLEVYHTRGDTAAGRPAERSRAAMPRLRVDRLSVARARAVVAERDGRPVESVSSLSLRAAVDGNGRRLRLTLHEGAVTWDSRGADLAELRGVLEADTAGVRAESLSGRFNGHRVSVRGGQLPGDVLDLRVVAERAVAGEVAALTGLDLGVDLDGALAAHIRAEGDSVTFAGDFNGRLEQWRLQGARGEAVFRPGEIDFHRVQGGVNDAWFDGAVAITRDPDGAAVVAIEGEASGLDLSRGLVPETDDLPRTWGHGHLRIVHHEADGSTLVTGRLADGEIAIMPFDSARVEVWATGDSLSLRRVDLRHRSLAARLAGEVDRDQVFTGRLDFTAGDLADLPADWDLPQLRGRIEGGGELHGPVDDLNLGGRWRLTDVQLGPLVLADGDATVFGGDVLGDSWSLQAAADGGRLVLGGVDLGRYTLRGRATPTEAYLDSFTAVRGDTVVALAGSAAIADGEASLQVDDLRIDFAGAHWRSTGPIAARAAPGYLAIPALHLESDQGVLAGELEYAADSLLAGDIVLSRFDTGLLHPLVPEAGRIAGSISARARLAGTPRDPVVELDGTLTNADFPLAYVDSLTVSGALRGGRLALDGWTLDSEFGRVRGRGTVTHRGAAPRDFWPGAELDLEVEVLDGDWAFLEQFRLPALDRLAGRVEGLLHVGGTTRAPLVTGELVSRPLHIHWLHLDELRGSVTADSSRLVLGDLAGHKDDLRLEGRLEIPLRMDFLSSPQSPLDGPFHARLVVPPGTNLEPLSRATNAFIESSGRGEGEILIDGPLAHPLYDGGFTVREGGFVLRDTEEIFHDVSARGRFDGDVLVLEELRGREGQQGTVGGTGTVTFRGLALTGFDVLLEVDRFLLATVPDLRALLRSRNAAITSVFVGPDSTLAPKFTGDFELIRGRYTGTFAAEPGAVDPTAATVSPTWLADVNIWGPPRSARILNRNMELDVSGDMRLVRDESGLYMLGSMDVDAGVMPVFNNTFRVARGRLDFSREVGIVPQVDLDAETRIRLRQPDGTSVVERVTVHAGGSLDAPEITYTSESGYPREAIERMLVGLAPYPDAQADQGALTQASLGAGMNLLEREIAGQIGFFDTVDLEQIQRQESALGLDPLIGLGKYIGDDLYVKYAQGFNQDDRDLQVEYQITNHLLLQTEIRRRVDEYQGDATYNIDLKHRVEY